MTKRSRREKSRFAQKASVSTTITGEKKKKRDKNHRLSKKPRHGDDQRKSHALRKNKSETKPNKRRKRSFLATP